MCTLSLPSLVNHLNSCLFFRPGHLNVRQAWSPWVIVITVGHWKRCECPYTPNCGFSLLLPFVGWTKGLMSSLSLSLISSLSLSLFCFVCSVFCACCRPFRMSSLACVSSRFHWVPFVATRPSSLLCWKIQLMPTGAERSDEPEGSESRKADPEENNRSF